MLKRDAKMLKVENTKMLKNAVKNNKMLIVKKYKIL